jgi:DNA repair protein RAD50
LQTSIAEAERTVDASHNVSTDLKTLEADIEEKKSRITKLQVEIKATNSDQKLAQNAAKARDMEDQRERLNAEMTSLSRQADTRARLDIKRSELKSKQTEVAHLCVAFASSYPSPHTD